jgi:hypothetical protein
MWLSPLEPLEAQAKRAYYCAGCGLRLAETLGMHEMHSGRELSYFETDVEAMHGDARAMHGIGSTEPLRAIISKRRLRRVCLSNMAREGRKL